MSDPNWTRPILSLGGYDPPAIAQPPAKLYGEITGEQTPQARRRYTSASGLPGIATTAGTGAAGDAFRQIYALAGYGQPPPGTYETYRQIIRHPTVVLANAALTAPILSSDWAYVVPEDRADDVPDERVAWVKAMLAPMRPLILREVLRSLYYGWQPFEKVYRLGSDDRLTLAKLKPLLPDLWTVYVERDNGRLAFLRPLAAGQAVGSDLPLNKLWLYSYNPEGGNYYGNPLSENVRAIWSQWMEVNRRGGQYGAKVAGVVPIILFPPGNTVDKDGVVRDNSYLAQQMLNQLGIAKGFAVPNLTAGQDDPRMMAEMAGRSLWQISFLDAGSSALQAGFIADRESLDRLLVRGWLLPERAVLEGQYGTKAEAETHGDLGLANSELIHRDIVRCLNWYVLDDLLAWNFGEDARGSVRIEPAPIIDEQKSLFRQLCQQLLTNPTTVPEAFTWFDWDAIVDKAGLPKLRVIDVDEQTGTLSMDADAGDSGSGDGNGNPLVAADRMRRLLGDSGNGNGNGDAARAPKRIAAMSASSVGGDGGRWVTINGNPVLIDGAADAADAGAALAERVNARAETLRQAARTTTNQIARDATSKYKALRAGRKTDPAYRAAVKGAGERRGAVVEQSRAAHARQAAEHAMAPHRDALDPATHAQVTAAVADGLLSDGAVHGPDVRAAAGRTHYYGDNLAPHDNFRPGETRVIAETNPFDPAAHADPLMYWRDGVATSPYAKVLAEELAAVPAAHREQVARRLADAADFAVTGRVNPAIFRRRK